MADRSYDLVVVGGGSAGLSIGRFGARIGARVAIVEGARLGGDCTWYGCVPSKALIAASATAHAARHAERFGLPRFEPRGEVDLGAVLDRVASVQQHIHDTDDSAEHMRELGCDVFEARGRFADPQRLVAGDRVIRSRRYVVATGSKPLVPSIPGLDAIPYFTNETVFTGLRVLPRHLLVVGAGPVGLELGQAFRRLGAEVTVAEARERVLPSGDPDASEELRRALEAEGVRFLLGATIERLWTEGGRSCAQLRQGGPGDPGAPGAMPERIEFDALLLATGRRPTVEGIGLDEAGIAYRSQFGIEVDERLRTTNPRVYAVGDVTGGHQSTHSAAAEARVVLYNTLTPIRKRHDARFIPSVTHTDPEVASVGLSEAEARREHGVAVRVYRSQLSQNDRARVDGREAGFAKLVCVGQNDELVGAQLVGHAAGEYISEYTLAMQHGLTAGDLTGAVHPYPTYALSGQYAAAESMRRVLDGRSARYAVRAHRWLQPLLDRVRGR